MGDFNRDKPTHTAFSKLRALGVTNVIVGDGVFTTLGSTATHVGANWYDNIWIDRQYTAPEFSGRFGVDAIHLRYYQNSEHPHLEVRKRISDHCPVWAELAESTDVQPRTHVQRRRWNVRLCLQPMRRGIGLRR